MRRKLFLGGLILVIILICVSSYLVMSRQTTLQSTEASQQSENITAGGHWHVDDSGKRVWHSEPHTTETTDDTMTDAEKAEDARLDAENAQLDKDIAELDANIARLDARIEARKKRMKANAAYIKQLEARAEKRKKLEKEAKNLAIEVGKFEIDFFSDAVELLPVFDMSYDEFHNTYRTVAERRDVVSKFAKIEKHRKAYRDLVENTSPDLRKMFYARLAEKGMLDTYKRVFLPDEVIKDATLKAIIAEHAEHPHIHKGR